MRTWAKGPREWQRIPMDLWGKDGSRPLDPTCTLSSGRSMSSLPTTALMIARQLGSCHQQGAPSPAHTPQSLLTPAEGRQATHCLGRRRVEGRRPNRLVLFHFFLQKAALLSPLGPGGSRGAGKTSGGKEAHANPGLQMEDPTILTAARVPCPQETGPGLYHHPYQVERMKGLANKKTPPLQSMSLALSGAEWMSSRQGKAS